MEDFDISIYSNESELAETTVIDALAFINSRLEDNDKCHVALTGGSLGNLIAEKLATELNKSNWSGLNIWWSDERYVPYDSTERNDLRFSQTIDKRSGAKIHRMPFTGNLLQDAKDFEAEISQVKLDLMILGVGPDGHIASLFPGQMDEAELRAAFQITDSPKPPAARITLSLRKINEANEIWLVASGSGKSEMIAELVDGDCDAPVSQVAITRLLVDSSAFGV